MSDSDLLEREEGATKPQYIDNDNEEKEIEAIKPDEIPFSKESKKESKSSKKRNRLLGGIVAIVVSGGIAGFMFFGPLLKLESFMNNINRRVFGFAYSAVENRAQHLLERYMISHVLTLQSCGNNITVDCRAKYNGVSAGLFATWRDVKIEQKLFDRFGISVETSKNPDPSTGKYQVTLRDNKRGGLIRLSDGDIKAGRFTGGNRELGREMKLFLKQETKWYEVMQRRSVRKYMERKHGTKFWCFFACKTKDNIDTKLVSAKTRMRYKFIERFIYPFSGKYGLILDCITSGTTGGRCSSEAIRERGIDRNKLSDADVEDILKRVDVPDTPNLKLSSYIIEKIASKIFSQQATKTGISLIPVAGQIYLAITIAEMTTSLDDFIKNNGLSKYAASINSAQYIEVYQGFRSLNDEMKSHKLSFSEVGAAVDEFRGAEQSLVYQTNNVPNYNPVSFHSGVVSAEGFVSDYRCDDGNPIDQGELVCEEKKVTRSYAVEDIRDNAALDKAISLLNNYNKCIPAEVLGECVPPAVRPRTVIKPILDLINSVSDFFIGNAVEQLLNIAEATPGVGGFIDYTKSVVMDMLNWFMGKVFPLPVDVDSPGREKYDGLEAGGELVANNFTKGSAEATGESDGLGGVQLSDEQAIAILNDNKIQNEYNSTNSDFMYKFASLDNPNSVLTKSVMHMPTDAGGLFSSLVTSFSNLFSNIFKIIGLINFNPVLATTTSNLNPFGITKYGYPVDSDVFSADPEIYTPEYCESTRLAREASKFENPQTGFDEYTVSDPCMLEKSAADSLEAYFTND